MRYNLSAKNSTYPERILYEFLKANKIPFKHRWLIEGREVDFVVGKFAIEIDGHEQNEEKNNMLVLNGYTPIHIHNDELIKNRKVITAHLLWLLTDFD